MTIHIESLTFETIIGLLDFEKERPQRVIIDLRASYDYEKEYLDHRKDEVDPHPVERCMMKQVNRNSLRISKRINIMAF